MNNHSDVGRIGVDEEDASTIYQVQTPRSCTEAHRTCPYSRAVHTGREVVVIQGSSNRYS